MKPIIKKLKNNLTVIYYRQSKFSNVYFNLSFPIGSINEKKDNLGITHFSEHLICRNATNYFKSKNEKEYLSENLFGHSHKNHTDFEFVVPGDDVKESLLIFETIINSPYSFLKKNDFEIERSIVIEEILEEQSNEATQEYLKDLEKIFFKGNPLSNRSLGDKNIVAKMNENLLKSFIKDNYSLENATFVIVGELGTEISMLKKVAQLGKVRGGSLDIKSPEINFPKETINLKNKKSLQNYFGLLFSFDKIQTVKESIEWFFVINSLESFLFERIRDKGYCYSLEVQSIVINGTRDLGIEANFDKKKTEGYYLALTQALRDFPQVLEKNLARYKNKERFRLMGDIDDIYEQGRLLTWAYANFGEIISLKEKMAVIEDIKAEDIKEYLGRHFLDKRGTLIIRGSLTKKQEFKIRKIWSEKIL